ncbi:MAG: Lrp/AsnC family transcriptional regulator [Pseudomonadota bacterium]
MLDDTDRRILRQFQAEPSLSISELAARVGLTATRCARRLDKMTEACAILGHEEVVDWVALGYAVEVSLRITLDKAEARATDDFIAAARDIPEVLEIQTFLGRVDVRLSVIARDLEHYQALYRDRILTLPHIADIEALMRIASVKAATELPV